MKNKVLTLLTTLGLLTVGVKAHAALITSSADLDSATVIDFSQFDIGSYTFTNGPIQVGELVGEDVVFTAQGPSPGLGGGRYGLLDNGSWTDPLGTGNGRDGYAFINNNGDFMDFTFNSGLVSGVGGFMNYCPTCLDGPAKIEALGVGGVLLESWDIETLAPINTPGRTNDGEFRGILRNTADIETFRVSNRIAVLDDLTFSRENSQSVPEPAFILGLLAVGALGATSLKRKQKKEVLVDHKIF